MVEPLQAVKDVLERRFLGVEMGEVEKFEQLKLAVSLVGKMIKSVFCRQGKREARSVISKRLQG